MTVNTVNWNKMFQTKPVRNNIKAIQSGLYQFCLVQFYVFYRLRFSSYIGIDLNTMDIQI